MLVEKLPDRITMQLFYLENGTDTLSEIIIFSSSKQWLHPLFDLEEFLDLHSINDNKNGYDFEFEDGLKVSGSNLYLRDRIIGRAAAFLIIRMGIRKIETDIISRRAIPLLIENSISFDTIETINTTNCMTEELLKDIYDTEEAYLILTNRRMKALEKMRI